jgi:hypothetical protein
MRLNTSGKRAATLIAAACITAAAIVACSDPLDVVTTSRIPAENVETPDNAQLLVDGAVADFECAFASYVVMGGVTGEEFIYAQQTADRTPNDARRTTPNDVRYATNSCTGLGVYAPLQTSRNSAESVLEHLKTWTDAQVPTNRQALIATSAAYAGYSLVLLGEGFCSMAISRINADRTIDYGGEIQPDSVFKLAIARFDEAIAAAQLVVPATAANTNILRLSYVGRARAKLRRGDYAGARADAALVPAGFSFNATYTSGTSVGRRSNLVFGENSLNNRSSSVGTPYRTMTGDPRVPVTSTTSTSATGIQHYYQTKYANAESPIRLGSYEEAQLIIAEADIQANTVASLANAVTILNAERARGNQGAYVGAVSQPALMAELIDQRRREFFLESQHLGDLIKYSITPTPAAGTPYHFGGGTYGSQICFPLPSAERLNNPKIGG